MVASSKLSYRLRPPVLKTPRKCCRRKGLSEFGSGCIGVRCETVLGQDTRDEFQTLPELRLRRARTWIMGLMARREQGFLASSQKELLEQCATILRQHDWTLSRNAALAPSPKGGKMRADILATCHSTGKRIAVFPRWQSSNGTAEEKVPFQLIKFEMALRARPDCAQAGYFVLEGPGWTWREFYLSGALYGFLLPGIRVKIVSLRQLAESAEGGEL